MPVGKALLTVVQTYYHQQEGMQPTQVETRYTRELGTDEQPYVRHGKVGSEWTRLDSGWLTECSLLVIKNNEGRFTDRIPTQEQRQEVMSRVIELAFGKANPTCSLLVHPNEAHPMHVTSLKDIWLRCSKGEAKLSVIIFPK